MEHSRTAPIIEWGDRIGVAAWRLVGSRRTTLVLLLLLLVVALLGGTLPQTRRCLSADTGSQQPEVAETSARWIGSAERVEALGLSSLFCSRLFRSLLGVAVGVALLRLLSLGIPSWVVIPGGSVGLDVRSVKSGPAEMWTRLSRAVAPAGLTLVRFSRAKPFPYAVARRAGARRWLPGLFYLGFLILLAASLIDWHFGWTRPQLSLALGESLPVDQSSGMSVRLDQIAFLPRDDGTMQRFDSYLQLSRSEGSLESLTTTQNSRGTAAGLAFYQLGFGPAVRVSAQKEGQYLNLETVVGDSVPQPVLRLRFSEQQQEQLLAIPEAGLVVRLVHYAQPVARETETGALDVQVLRGRDGKLLGERFFTGQGEVSAEGVDVQVTPEYYVALRVEREPGLPLAALALALMLAGMLGFCLWPPRELWLSVSEDGKGCQCTLYAPRRNVGAPWLRGIEDRLSGEDDG